MWQAYRMTAGHQVSIYIVFHCFSTVFAVFRLFFTVFRLFSTVFRCFSTFSAVFSVKLRISLYRLQFFRLFFTDFSLTFESLIARLG